MDDINQSLLSRLDQVIQQNLYLNEPDEARPPKKKIKVVDEAVSAQSTTTCQVLSTL